MRDLDYMKLACVIDACGGVDGRVKMQKIVYLLKAMGYELPFDDFRIRQLGPFSRGVAVSADLLTAAGFVIEEEIDLGANQNTGEPVKQYLYNVSESIKQLLKQRFNIPKPAGKPAINKVACKLRACDRAVLEVAATKVYLQREDKLKGNALDAELRRLKGHLSNRFGEAESLIGELKKQGWL